jgi:hypothetical protein
MGIRGEEMYCSTCGAGEQHANAYCKRCGQWLPDISNRMAFGGETPQQNIFTGLFMSGLSTVAALISAIALYATYLGTSDAKWSVYLAAAFCLCIAGWQASSFAVTLKLRRRMKQGHGTAGATAELGQNKPAQALPAGDSTAFVSVPPVTENTTELLQPRRNQTEPQL